MFLARKRRKNSGWWCEGSDRSWGHCFANSLGGLGRSKEEGYLTFIHREAECNILVPWVTESPSVVTRSRAKDYGTEETLDTHSATHRLWGQFLTISEP